MKKTLAQKAYLTILCANGYEDQQPEYIAAKWHDLLYFFVPIIGFFLFCAMVQIRYYNNLKN